MFLICLRFRNIEIKYIRKIEDIHHLKYSAEIYLADIRSTCHFSISSEIVFCLLLSVYLSDLLVKYAYMCLRVKVILTAFNNSFYFSLE